ncbi:long-chain fatty acid--CoA ligase [Ketobacter sp. MCCC 1A13808]|uniref:long-chain-fatty-acid--CoA ligase n=1 Tax=Ketobacter sp. MCCC 1A13808 TaxID=2602738 RepID=UPI0012EB68A1|nr:long-chain-fatty-acid--CoA ligase [Ketobacter sp. MCCC 1A13808]MVF13509.1 long-chain fatty acid--CoA ligase [Ketobacter sp. MCCC 1A13808]
MNTTESLSTNLQRIPENIAIIQGSLHLSWSELHDHVANLAAGLQHLGVKDGDHVATLLGNTYRNIESTYAVQWLGAAIVPINIRWSAPEVEFAIEDCESTVLLVDKQNWPTVEKLSDRLRTKLTLIWADDGSPPADLDTLDGLIASHQPILAKEVAGSTVSSIFYTGGTTGRSKGVLLSHDNQMSHSIAFIADCGLAASGSNYLHAAPMFHIADSLFTHVVSLLGGTHIILPQFTPLGVAQMVTEHRGSFTVLVPTMIQMIMAEPAVADDVFNNLNRLFYGASPMPETITKQILKHYPDLDMTQCYGQTESSPVLTLLKSDGHGKGEPLPQAKSAGRAMMGTEIRIADEDDQILATGETGEVIARGPQVMRGYWKREAETEKALRGGWLHTGDAGFMDEQGFVYIVDRIKDMIISGGENVYSVEVEQAIYELPSVAQCAVIGLPHDKWGETVHAVVVPKPSHEITEEQITTHCKVLLADYKQPRSITIRTEALPLSGAGKILKRELRTELTGE